MANWRETIDVKEPFRDDNLSLEDKTKEILKIFKESKWYKASQGNNEYDNSIFSWVEEMEYILEYEPDELSEHLFNIMWDAMYDYADRDKIWVNVW